MVKPQKPNWEMNENRGFENRLPAILGAHSLSGFVFGAATHMLSFIWCLLRYKKGEKKTMETLGTRRIIADKRFVICFN